MTRYVFCGVFVLLLALCGICIFIWTFILIHIYENTFAYGLLNIKYVGNFYRCIDIGVFMSLKLKRNALLNLC